MPRQAVSPIIFPCILCLLVLSGCTTIQNRRDLYFPQKTEGPYTRMLQNGLSAPSPTPLKSTGAGSNGKDVVTPSH
jgi:hypothetical protein